MKKELKYYFITATITFGILILIYLSTNALGNTFFISDSYEQYLPLLSKLSSIFKGDSSLFYNFNGALGNSFFETFLYYLASPFNILIIFFKDINIFIIVITALKLITASLTSFSFFNYHFKDNKLYSIMFSLCYVFLTYNIVYSFHIMWLDAVYLLPLVLLGIDKHIKEKKSLLFIISLVLVIITNYYFGYMICIFSFIYFNYKLLLSKEIKNNIIKIIKDNIKFILLIILSLLISAFVLLPVVSTISSYSRSDSRIANSDNIYFNLNVFDFFRQFLIGSNVENNFLNHDKFLLYSSVLTIPLLILYFMNKVITKKEKVLSAIILLLLFLSTSCNFINYMWHGFSPPQCFNGRYTFIFSLFIILLNFKSLLNIKYIEKYKMVVCLIITVIILYILLFMKLPNSDLYINFVFVFFYILILYFIDSKKIFVPLILIGLVGVELATNSIAELSSYDYKNNNIYTTHNKVYDNILNYINNKDNSIFYRIETNETEPYNTPIRYNFYGIDSFLSTSRNTVSNFFDYIGYSSANTISNTISYYSGTEVIDSILGIKYHISFNQYDFNNRYLLLNEYDAKWLNNSEIKVSIYQNPYSLSLGYMVNKKIKYIEKNSNIFRYQNDILSSMSGINKDIYTAIDLNDDLEFTNTSLNDIYLYTSINTNKNYTSYSLYLNRKKLIKTHDFEIIKVTNSYDINQLMKLSYSNLDENIFNSLWAAYYNEDVLDEIIDELKANELIIEKFNDSYIKGYVYATDDKSILFTSIPYDNNWDIYVDGKKHNSIKVIDAMLAIELESGKHTIEFKYRPKEFYAGLLISFLTILLALLFKLKKSLKK